MNASKKLLWVSAAFVVTLGIAAPVRAQTTETTTVTTPTTTTVTTPVTSQTVVQNTTVRQVDIPNAEKIDFKAFDLNHDGILSTAEVGEKLFYVFDQDGNHVIDNIEFNRKTVLTIIPMEKQTVTMTYDVDGNVDSTKYTTETFTEKSGLARFAKSPGGLSPADFIGKAFNQLDVNKDGVIDIAEWKGAYIKSLDKSNREAARYNQ